MASVFVRELSLKYRGPRRKVRFETLCGPDAAANFLRSILPDNVREHFVALFLDNRHQVTGYYVAATGTASHCPAGTREVFQAALLGGASALIMAHNHTSAQNRDELTPSPEDLSVTHRFSAAGDLLGVSVLDHIVIGGHGFYSFKEHARMRPIGDEANPGTTSAA